MFRGTIVGRVESLQLTSDTSRVEVKARITPTAISLAKENSLWWVVQPSVSLQGVEGLDTIAGPRYIEVLPNGGEPSFTFEGTESVVSFTGKQFILVTNSADNVTVGAPLYYRGVEIGQVTYLSLSSDSTTVRVTCNVKTTYAPLIRTNTKFWNISGISLDANLLGFELHAGPLTSWIKGGIALATPTNPGDEAPEGYAFTIAPKVNKDWLEWSPSIELNEAQQ
jgi:paraquat-inducible protein B